MKLIDKIKNAIFEDDELEEEKEIVKKIDVEKTINEEKKIIKPVEEKTVEVKKPDIVHREEKIKKPIIFEDEDFEMEEKVNYKKPEVKKPEVKKPLYGGYGLKEDKIKDKFKPSPVLSPVYGIMEKQDLEKQEVPKKSLESLFHEEKKPEVTFDTIRQKAYGEIIEEKKDDNVDLFYEMHEDIPGVDKVTLGDAEEYYQDLGLEYNIDYKDKNKSKEKDTMTRRKKNKELSDIVNEEIKENEKIKEETKNKVSKKTDEDEVDEKNLYDLIDMMYDGKE